MRTTAETLAWLRQEHLNNTTAWLQLCLKLCRSARGIPAYYPSALAAQVATPEEDRVYDLDKVTRGMVMYFDDPNDSNPYGHIVTVAGRNKEGELLTWSNDVRDPGQVDLVRASFFPTYWGDKFQFAATSLNGVDLLLPTPKPKLPLRKRGQDRIRAIILDLNRMIATHEEKGHTRLVKALKRDRSHMQAILEEFSR